MRTCYDVRVLGAFTAKSHSALTRKQNENELASHNALTPGMPRENQSQSRTVVRVHR